MRYLHLLVFSIWKKLGYLRVYGLHQTYSIFRYKRILKEVIQSHPKTKKWRNSDCNEPNSTDRVVALIGAGRYAFTQISRNLRNCKKNFLLYTYSPSIKSAISLSRFYNGLFVPIKYEEIIEDKDVKIVFIESSKETHARYAISCIEQGKNVYIEKPPISTLSELSLLTKTMAKNPDTKIVLGFNRPKARLFKILKNYADEQNGPIYANWHLTIGSHMSGDMSSSVKESILDHWCHFTDLAVHLIGWKNIFPCKIISKYKKQTEGFSFTIHFANKSCISFTQTIIKSDYFTEKETFNLNKGELFAVLKDSSTLFIENNSQTKSIRNIFRDYGHKTHISESFKYLNDPSKINKSADYIITTCYLYLLIIESFQSSPRTSESLEKIKSFLMEN